MKKILLSIFLLMFFILFITNFVWADTDFVYVTKNGSKFHSYGCDYLNSSPIKINLDTAINRGYSPCKACNPFGLADYYEEENDYFIANLILTIVLYMGIPLFLYFRNMKFDNIKQVRTFVIANSVIVFLIYFFIYLALGTLTLPNIIPPFFYGMINFIMLRKNVYKKKKKIPTAYIGKNNK